MIKTWSSTQKQITLSSGEAELMAMAKGASEAIGLAQMFEEWVSPRTVEVRTDSSVAVGTVHRTGNGKLRHVRINDLWLQERVKEGSLTVTNVGSRELRGHLDQRSRQGRPRKPAAKSTVLV